MPEQDEPQDAAPPSILEQISSALDSAKEKLFKQPIPNELEQHTGVPSSEFKLVDRQVTVNAWDCGAGHKHRDILLVETFKQAAEGAEPALSLDAAVTKFKEEAAVEPEGSLGFASETQAYGGFKPGDEEGTLQKFFMLRAAYDTEASLNPPEPQGIDLATLLALLQGRGRGGPPTNDGPN